LHKGQKPFEEPEQVTEQDLDVAGILKLQGQEFKISMITPETNTLPLCVNYIPIRKRKMMYLNFQFSGIG